MVLKGSVEPRRVEERHPALPRRDVLCVVVVALPHAGRGVQRHVVGGEAPTAVAAGGPRGQRLSQPRPLRSVHRCDVARVQRDEGDGAIRGVVMVVRAALRGRARRRLVREQPQHRRQAWVVITDPRARGAFSIIDLRGVVGAGVVVSNRAEQRDHEAIRRHHVALPVVQEVVPAAVAR